MGVHANEDDNVQSQTQEPVPLVLLRDAGDVHAISHIRTLCPGRRALLAWSPDVTRPDFGSQGRPVDGEALLRKAELWRFRASQTANVRERDKFLYLANQYLRLAHVGAQYGRCSRHPPR